MSKYNDKYIKLANDPRFWLVEDGERRPMADMEEVYAYGLLPVVTVSPKTFESIPVKGEKKSEKEKEGGEVHG